MRCIICDLEKEGSKEHIIPEAMGNSRLVTYKVCEECNNMLGNKVDCYLTDYIINKIVRKNLGLLGKEEKEIKIFPSTLIDENGDEYLMRGDIPKIKANTKLNDGVLHIEAENIEEILAIGKKRLLRMGKSQEEANNILSKHKIGKTQYMQPTFKIQADIDMSRYLLSGIKIAYEYTCELLGENYLDDDIAKIFRKELYKASRTDKNDMDCIDYMKIKQYASLPLNETIQLKRLLQPILDGLQPKARHVIMLHDSADHKMICEVLLCFLDFMSFTVCVSNDATRYLNNNKYKISIVLEDEQVITL
jgi:hypothetical protein